MMRAASRPASAALPMATMAIYVYLATGTPKGICRRQQPCLGIRLWPRAELWPLCSTAVHRSAASDATTLQGT